MGKRSENPAAEVQIYQITCKTKGIRDEVVGRCKSQNGSRVLFSGRDDEGNFVIIHAITGSAIKLPASTYYGKWGFPDLTQESVEDYYAETSVKISGNH